MISRAKIHCNGVTTVQDIRDYASLIFGTQCSFCFSLSLSLSLSLKTEEKSVSCSRNLLRDISYAGKSHAFI